MAIIVASLGVGLFFLFLVILGVMREVVILREQVAALSQLITDPPKPSFVGAHLPAPLAERLAFLSAEDQRDRTHVILFLSGGCSGWESLVAGIARSIETGDIRKGDLTCVVAEVASESAICEAAQSVSEHVIVDSKGVLFRACEVRGTPTQLAVASDSLEVFDYMLGGDLAWIHERLQPETLSIQPYLAKHTA